LSIRQLLFSVFSPGADLLATINAPHTIHTFLWISQALLTMDNNSDQEDTQDHTPTGAYIIYIPTLQEDIHQSQRPCSDLNANLLQKKGMQKWLQKWLQPIHCRNN
jgi:hypothetical protein